MDFLYSFGCGISFVVGVVCGCTILAWCVGTYSKENRERTNHADSLFPGHVENTRRMMVAMERLADVAEEAHK